MRLVAYAYDAAVTCIACTQQRFADGYFTTPDAADLDDNLIPQYLYGREGNEVAAIFEHDEVGEDGLTCDECQLSIVDRYGEEHDEDADDVTFNPAAALTGDPYFTGEGRTE